MAVLVTGGAGYIGSVTTNLLQTRGESVVVLDDLKRGHRSAVQSTVPFYQGRIGDRALIARIAAEHHLEACLHFAALAYVGESVLEPAKYFENNVEQGIALVEALLSANVRRIVFSSTCATYGDTGQNQISENCAQWPSNPYGWTKLAIERMLDSCDAAFDLKFVALRYFNAAGATAELGESHEPESHLIPNILSAALGNLAELSVFGNDYPTPDGTAVRDYVHVSDLADGHILALDYLRRGGCSQFINLGSGSGYSVLEVIEAARTVTGRSIPFIVRARRIGDPPKLVADAKKARTVLGWVPEASNLSSILRSQWVWRQKHPCGYS